MNVSGMKGKWRSKDIEEEEKSIFQLKYNIKLIIYEIEFHSFSFINNNIKRIYY